jgi:hypothetical protein
MDWRCQFDSRAVRKDTVVAGGVNRFRGNGGIGFTRAVRAWRAQATSVRDRDCGLVCTAGRGDKGNLPSRVVCPCSLLRFPFGQSRGRRAEERDDGRVPLVGEARGNGRGPCWAASTLLGCIGFEGMAEVEAGQLGGNRLAKANGPARFAACRHSCMSEQAGSSERAGSGARPKGFLPFLVILYSFSIYYLLHYD